MSEYAIVAPEDFDQSVFRLIGKEWMLVTAKNQEGKVNTMTASWGGLVGKECCCDSSKTTKIYKRIH